MCRKYDTRPEGLVGTVFRVVCEYRKKSLWGVFYVLLCVLLPALLKLVIP